MRQTRPSNANAHPGRPVLEAEAEERLQNAKRKPRTKKSKVTNDPHANESPEEKSAQIQKAAERIAGIEDDMVTLEGKALGNKPKPVRPRPHPHAKGKSQQVPTKDAASDTPTVDDRPEDMLLSAGEADVVAEKPGKKQTAEKMKTLLKEAIRNAQNFQIKTDSNNNSDIDTRLSLGSYIKNWANDVLEKAYPKSNTLSSRSESHAPTPPQSILSAATTSTSTSSKATSASINKEKATKPDIHESDDVLMVSDVDSLDDHPDGLEQCPAALCWKGKRQSDESDSKPEQMTYDFIDETGSEASSEATDNSDILIDDSQEMTGFMPEVTAIPTTEKKEYAPHKTTSVHVSTIVSQNAAPPQPKKLKKESSESTNDDNLVPPPSTQVPAGYYNNTVPPLSTQVPPGHWMTAVQEVIKLCGQYHNTDLPVPANSKWVNPNGAVFAVTQQRLLEWRSNIGSAALAIIVDFYSHIKDTPNAEVAKHLLKKYVIPALNTDELSLEGMDGAIVLCIVALERALKFVRDNIIKVKEVLVSMATGECAVKLPMVLNKATGKMSSGCYKFSFANCHEETESYMKSFSNRSDESKATIIARSQKLMKKSPMKAECSDNDDEESINERALICNNHSISLPTPYATDFPAAFILLVPIMYSLIHNFYCII
ncbi:hypothetical protein BDR03DRAFT_1018861 [Suillus americanus]|nr:hypothetical protein BDR03DRAFT_1018861 [Suillus americanus]